MSRRAQLWITGGLIFGGLGALAVGALVGGPPECTVPGSLTAEGKAYASPPPMTIDEERLYRATVETTLGTLRIDLFTPLAPVTVNNFVFLARDGFYDGTTFHRVEVAPDHALIQGGDPTGTGCGGSGYTVEGEKPSPIVPYKRGVLAALNLGDATTNTSQFFIIVEDYEELGQPTTTLPRYTVFGLINEEDDESLRVLDAIAGAPREGTRPDPPVRILRMSIEEGPKIA